MWGYNTPYDHVYIKLQSNEFKRTILFQASKTLVNFMNPDIFYSDNTIVREFTFTASRDVYKKIIDFAWNNVGREYGVKLAFGLAWVRINAIFGKVIKNPFSDGGATYVCSSIGCVAAQDLGLTLPKDIDDMSPLDTYNVLMSTNNKALV